MGRVFAKLGAWLLAIIPSFLTTVAVYLGVGMVAYQGFGAVIDQFESVIKSNLGALPNMALAVISIAKVDQAISMIMSAVSIRLTFMGLTATSIPKQMRWKF